MTRRDAQAIVLVMLAALGLAYLIQNRLVSLTSINLSNSTPTFSLFGPTSGSGNIPLPNFGVSVSVGTSAPAATPTFYISAPNNGNPSPSTTGICTPPNGWYAYTIQSGDTLSSLAANTNTLVSEIVRVNCLSNADMITVGQVIYLPVAQAPTPFG
jgi:hypothetical protein